MLRKEILSKRIDILSKMIKEEDLFFKNPKLDQLSNKLLKIKKVISFENKESTSKVETQFKNETLKLLDSYRKGDSQLLKLIGEYQIFNTQLNTNNLSVQFEEKNIFYQRLFSLFYSNVTLDMLSQSIENYQKLFNLVLEWSNNDWDFIDIILNNDYTFLVEKTENFLEKN